MTTALTPGNERELAAIVADAAARRSPLAIAGGGTRSGLGRPIETAATLSTAGLTGVTLYEPAELVLSARSGTPLAEVEALLAGSAQRLAFEPIDHRGIFGSTGAPTIGALAAANLSGPRRLQAGAARDSLIGVRAVTGRGEAVKSGGRVMKNVTGYDLVRFLAGSYGTLAVLAEVTFKVLPTPDSEATIVLTGLDDRRAVAALAAALGSPFSVSGAAHVPPIGAEPARTYVRLEGFAPALADRAERLRAELKSFATADLLEASASAAVWRAHRDLETLDPPAETPIWRVSVKPSDGPTVAAAARRAFACRVLYDWGGGLVWIAGGAGADAGAAVVRDAVRTLGGHANLVRAPGQVRQSVAVFHPLAPPIMALTLRLKASFDPAGILNPGRMYAGV